MTFKIIGTTLLAAAGACGSAAVYSHLHNSHLAEARGHSRGERFSRKEHGDHSFAQDFRPGRRRTEERTWDDRGR
jgi:hypothetical protein